MESFYTENKVLTFSVTIYQPSKLDLDRMSLSNNLSEVYQHKQEEVNLYADTNRNEVARLSVHSQRRVPEALPVPLSDPEFSNKKFVKNQKMKDYLEKINQNPSNKSFISLQENKEVFSRKNSSMHESGCFKAKGSRTSKNIGSQVKFRLVQKSLHEPRSFRFSDILEEKRPLNVQIPEFPDGSNTRGISFQSSKSVERLLHGPALANTRHASYMGRDQNVQQSGQALFKKYEEVCTELMDSIVHDACLEHVERKKERDRQSQKAEHEKKKKWGKCIRKFERQTREYLSSKEFPWKISADEVLEFLNHFAEFLCTNKLDSLVRNINIGNIYFLLG